MSQSSRTAAVDQFLAQLEHPLQAEIEAVRALILDANPRVTERIKWNAPSFCVDGADRVTMKLHPTTRLQLVFHRGARVRADDFTFEDRTGLLEWVAGDRALVTLHDLQDVQTKAAALTNLVNAWIMATPSD